MTPIFCTFNSTKLPTLLFRDFLVCFLNSRSAKFKNSTKTLRGESKNVELISVYLSSLLELGLSSPGSLHNPELQFFSVLHCEIVRSSAGFFDSQLYSSAEVLVSPHRPKIGKYLAEETSSHSISSSLCNYLLF